MATKKKAPAKKAEPKTDPMSAPGPIRTDEGLFFSPYDLTRYELAQAKLKIATQAFTIRQLTYEIGNLQMEMAKLKKAYEHKGFKDKLQEEVQNTQEELVKLQTEIEGIYSVSLKDVAYDDVTGKINTLPDKGI